VVAPYAADDDVVFIGSDDVTALVVSSILDTGKY
jgi:hypothetical protein